MAFASGVQSKSEIEKRLQVKQFRLNLLDTTIAKTHELAISAKEVITRFELSLNKLEATAKPVNDEATRLLLKADNIQRARKELNCVLDYYKKINETLILDEPNLENVNDYVDDLERLRSAMSYFHNIASATSEEYVKAKALVEKGAMQLERLLFTELSRHSRPLPSNILLDLIDDDDFQRRSLSGGTVFQVTAKDVLGAYCVPLTVVSSAARICQWMFANRNATQSHQSTNGVAYLDRLIELRSKNVRASMTAYRDMVSSDQYPAISGPLGAQQQQHAVSDCSNRTSGLQGKANKLDRQNSSSSTGSSNAVMTLRPTKRQAQKKLELPKRKPFAAMFSDDFVQQLGLLHVGGKRNASDGTAAKEFGSFSSLEEVLDTETFVNQVQVGLCALQVEVMLFNSILPDGHRGKFTEDLSGIALGDVLTDCQVVSRVTGKLIAKGDYRLVLAVASLLSATLNLKSSFDLLVGSNESLKTRLRSLMNQLHATVLSALEDYTHNVKNSAEKVNMPKDGTVHELTSNTMMFLESLLDCSEIIGVLLNSPDFEECSDFLPLLTNQSQDDSPARLAVRQNFGQYVTKVLEALGSALSIKVEHYSSESLRALFTMNNCNYIQRTLRRSGLLPFVVSSPHSSAIEQQYETEVAKCLSRLRASWLPLIRAVRLEDDAEMLNVAQLCRNANENAKLPEKWRKAIKDTFANFNKELEAFVAASREQTIVDREIRAQLIAELRAVVVQGYARLHSAFAHLLFAKKREKYVRYSREHQLDALFDSLFQGGAMTSFKS